MRPKPRRSGQRGRRKEVYVDVPEPLSHQAAPLDECKHLGIGGGRRKRKIAKQREYFVPIAKIATGKLANHKGMHQDELTFQGGREP